MQSTLPDWLKIVIFEEFVVFQLKLSLVNYLWQEFCLLKLCFHSLFITQQSNWWVAFFMHYTNKMLVTWGILYGMPTKALYTKCALEAAKLIKRNSKRRLDGRLLLFWFPHSPGAILKPKNSFLDVMKQFEQISTCLEIASVRCTKWRIPHVCASHP